MRTSAEYSLIRIRVSIGPRFKWVNLKNNTVGTSNCFQSFLVASGLDIRVVSNLNQYYIIEE